MPGKLLSVVQMAERLGVAKSTLYALAKARRIPHLKIGDRVLFDPEKVEAALEIEATGDEETLGTLPIDSKGRRQVAGTQ